MKKLFAMLMVSALTLATPLISFGAEETVAAHGFVVADPAQLPEGYFSQNVDITNSTGVTIVEMYISISEQDTWGEDLLGEGVLPANETVSFTSEYAGTADATWDIRIVDQDGDEMIFEAVNFSSITKLSVHWGEDGQTPTLSME